MSQIATTLVIGQGTPNGSGGWNPPAPTGSVTRYWKQATELTPGNQTDWNPAKWTTPSSYFCYYLGMNESGEMKQPSGGNGRPSRENGLIKFPPNSDNEFTVGKQGQTVLENVKVVDFATSNHYTPLRQGANWKVVERTHSDPSGQYDHFYVWGNAGGSGSPPTIMRDPAIRNRNQAGVVRQHQLLI